jgi:hypothetical protein
MTMDLYEHLRRLDAAYDTITARADWHGATWADEAELDELVAEMNRVQELIDAQEANQ